MNRRETDFAALVAAGRLADGDRALFNKVYNERYRANLGDRYLDVMVSAVRPKPGEPPTRRIDLPPASRLATLAAAHPPRTAGLDDDGDRLHQEIETLARAEDVDFFTALARKTGDHTLTAVPVVPVDGADPARASLDRRAREAMQRLAVNYLDAATIVDLDDRVAEAEADTGDDDLPWRDTSKPAPPRPYPQTANDEDWARDERRAEAAGVLQAIGGRERWQVAAEEGRDLVHEVASQARKARVDGLKAERDRVLQHAQAAEAGRRGEAINAELTRRARERLGQS